MKKAIKIALTTMVIMCMMLGAMHWFKSHQEEKRLIRQDQERIAQYILDNVELVDGSEINKIKFMQYEKNVSTQIWSIGVEINEKVLILIKENKKNSEIWISSSNEKINITKGNKVYKKGSIEIIYIEGKE